MFLLPMRKARLRGIKKFFQDHTVWTWQTQTYVLLTSCPALLLLGYTSPLLHITLVLVIAIPVLPVHELIENRNPVLHKMPTAREKRKEKNDLLYFSFWKRNSPKHLELTFYPNTSSSKRLIFHCNFVLLILFLSNYSY